MRLTRMMVVSLGCAAMAGCLSNAPQADSGAPDGGVNVGNNMPTSPAPPAPAAPPTLAPYVRGSLKPVYQLTPRNEYGRIQQGGVSMTDTDFESNQVSVSAAAKMDEIAALPELLGGPGDLIPNAEDRQRATLIPMRGNPTDVKALSVNGTRNIYVPLGGDVMTAGNEVAAVQNGQVVARIKVGLRPQRIAIHPAGLVFVCNEYSNYISVIDPTTNQLLQRGGKPVEIKTEYYCADMAFAPAGNVQDVDHQNLYVANRWRHSVLKYQANIIRDALSNRPIDVVQSATPDPNQPNKPVAEILGVGNNPFRLTLSDQQDALFCANNKGGEVSRIDLRTDTVAQRISINAPSADVVNIQDLLYVPTLMPDRGFLANDDTHPTQVFNSPMVVKGLDNLNHVAHPGALFDNTKSYNFEDLRNGLFQLDFKLNSAPATNQPANDVYYTDDNSSEPNFQSAQKVLAGALPTTIVRNAAGTQIFVAMGGSDIVQQLNVNTGARPFTVTKGKSFKTGHRPFGIALDEKNNQLLVANWGGETLEIFDLGTTNRVGGAIDLGYAQPAYPATNIEKGEFFFYNAAWSNNQRKACATCHFDELDTDGVGFGNGATAPTAPHQVKPNHNLATTDSYFWNGSFGDGNYTSVAFAAQTRDNCELVEFGLIEGVGSNAQQRVGDPNNQINGAAAGVNDNDCRPQPIGGGKLGNQAAVDAAKKAELAFRDNVFLPQQTGLDIQSLSRVIDFYSVSELRLPPNPLHQLKLAKQLSSDVAADIDNGKTLFQSAGCATCHDPNNTRHPFADGLNHGRGADWIARFINTYQADNSAGRVLDLLAKAGVTAALPQTFLQANAPSVKDHEVNVHQSPIDFFIPFCFDGVNCFEFDDPLAVFGTQAEKDRLALLVPVNLADPDRQFIPGNVVGQPQINTPSLRGVWTQANLLHNGLGHTIAEAILAPGHPALGPGETGFAVDVSGAFDVHGTTKSLTADQVKALIRYVENIE